MTTTENVYVVIIVILAIAVAVLFFLYIRQGQVLISPLNCPTIEGSYGVIAGFSATPLTNCGNGTQICQFTVTSLTDAENKCNVLSTCQAFTYTPSTGTVFLVNPATKIQQSTATDLYIKQI